MIHFCRHPSFRPVISSEKISNHYSLSLANAFIKQKLNIFRCCKPNQMKLRRQIENGRQFSYNTVKEQLHISRFRIFPMYDDALLVSGNELLHPFRKAFFACFFFGTHLAPTLEQLKSSCNIACANPQLIYAIGLIHRCSRMIKSPTLCMCSTLCDVDGRADRIQSNTLVLPAFKSSIHPNTFH